MSATAYIDGSCLPHKGYCGGFASLVVSDGTEILSCAHECHTTNQRMELSAAIEALDVVPPGGEVTIHTDSSYVYNGATGRWNLSANLDLWDRLFRLIDVKRGARRAAWVWVPGHASKRTPIGALIARVDRAARQAAENCNIGGP